MDALEEWAMWLRADGAAKQTVRTRTGGIRALCGHQALTDPTLVTARQLASWLSECASPWTRSTYWASANAWCRWLIAEGIRVDNPLERISRPQVPRDAPRPVPMDVVRRIVLTSGSPRSRAYVILAAFAGLRVHEIAKVRGEDVATDGGWLYVTGKGGQRAAVPLHELVATLAGVMPATGYWFTGSDAGHVWPNSVSIAVHNALAAAGSTASAHALRHTFGTEILRASKDLRVTQEALRHKSITSTQIYTQVSSADLQAAVRSLDWAAA